jgi:hypothetical protein
MDIASPCCNIWLPLHGDRLQTKPLAAPDIRHRGDRRDRRRHLLLADVDTTNALVGINRGRPSRRRRTGDSGRGRGHLPFN